MSSFGFYKQLHGKKHMAAYAKVMEQFDLSDEAIKEFAKALKQGDLNSIKKLFGDLSKQQKSGLLRLYIDYNVIENTELNNQPRGFALDLAKKFQHNEVSEYLSTQANEIDPNILRREFTKSSSPGLFAHRGKTPLNNTEQTSKMPKDKNRINFALHKPADTKKDQTAVDSPKTETTPGMQRR